MKTVYKRIIIYLTIILGVLLITLPVKAIFAIFAQSVESPGGSSFSGGIALDPTEQTLYFARNDIDIGTSMIDSVYAYRRDAATGLLSFLDEEFISDYARSIAVSPDGKHVYAGHWSETIVSIFQRNSDGSLEPPEFFDTGILSEHMVFHPNGERLYVGGSLNAGTLLVYARNPNTGQLTELQKFTDGMNGVTDLGTPFYIVVSPDDKHVYVANRSGVVVFRQIGGQLLELVEIQQGNLTGLNGATNIAISPDGKYLYVLGQNDSAIAIFARDSQTGRLTYSNFVKDGLNGVEVPSTLALAISPDGQYVYAGPTVFERNTQTGDLTFIEKFHDFSAYLDTVISSDGRHLYMSSLGSAGGLVNFFSTDIPNVNVACLSVTTIPLLECNGLATLFNSTNGPNWTNNVGWTGLTANAADDPCTWYGVTCAGGHVTELNLANNNLEGTIPAELGDLTQLLKLYLNGNPKLSGVLPASLTNLTQLNTFYFNDTNLVESPSPAFQSWLNGIADVQSTGKIGSLVYLPVVIK